MTAKYRRGIFKLTQLSQYNTEELIGKPKKGEEYQRKLEQRFWNEQEPEVVNGGNKKIRSKKLDELMK